MDVRILMLFFSAFIIFSCQEKDEKTSLVSGQKITESITLEKDTFYLPANGDPPALSIEGENIVVDFNGSMLVGSRNMERPDLFEGTAIHVSGNNVTVKNVNVHGYKTGLYAEGVDSLKVLDCNFSFNHECSIVAGGCEYAVVRIDSCSHTHLKGLKITNCENGIYSKNANCKIYNNKIQFNSGCGIKLHDSKGSWIMHNNIDWNGLAISLDSSDANIIFKNSLTHNLALETCSGKNVSKLCGSNVFSENDYSFSFKNGNDSLSFIRNFIFKNIGPKFSDGMPTNLDPALPQGRKYILKNKWGIYNFKYPSIWLRNIEDNKYTFLLYGPPTGNYKIIDGKGWEKLNRVTGAFPATLIATAKPDAEKLSLELEFIGQEFIDQFGRVNKKGKVYPFRWEEDRVESRE